MAYQINLRHNFIYFIHSTVGCFTVMFFLPYCLNQTRALITADKDEGILIIFHWVVLYFYVMSECCSRKYMLNNIYLNGYFCALHSHMTTGLAKELGWSLMVSLMVL